MIRRRRTVQAQTHNTWTIAPGDTIIVEMTTAGGFSLFNIGPGFIWCSWRSDRDVAIDDENSIKIRDNMGYNWEGDVQGQRRSLQITADPTNWADTEVTTVVGG